MFEGVDVKFILNYTTLTDTIHTTCMYCNQMARSLHSLLLWKACEALGFKDFKLCLYARVKSKENYTNCRKKDFIMIFS